MSPQVVRCRKPGFTLVELLVVIGIIGILIALLLTVVPRVKKAVYAAQTQAQLSALSGAIQQYYNDFKAYPGPLANNQLGAAYDPGTPVYPNADNYPLTGTNGITLSQSTLLHITGTQNMTLGLLGGLEFTYTNGTPTAFVYNPLDIFPDGKTPGPVGAASLSTNASNARRQQSYIQVRPGDISLPSMTYNGGKGASFADSAGRSPSDAPIPVFLDKYPDPMPILYIRTNSGGQAVVGVRNTDGSGNALVDPQYNTPETPQYDLCQIFDYTLPNTNNAGGNPFGVNVTSLMPYHGLRGVGSQYLGGSGGIVDGIGTTTKSTQQYLRNGYANNGNNALAYFRDPNFKADENGSYDPAATNAHAGVAREKNGFLLISAGPDRAYGTTDDLIYPGSLLVAQ